MARNRKNNRRGRTPPRQKERVVYQAGNLLITTSEPIVEGLPRPDLHLRDRETGKLFGKEDYFGRWFQCPHCKHTHLLTAQQYFAFVDFVMNTPGRRLSGKCVRCGTVMMEISWEMQTIWFGCDR